MVCPQALLSVLLWGVVQLVVEVVLVVLVVVVVLRLQGDALVVLVSKD